jgi:hypothetical protein
MRHVIFFVFVFFVVGYSGDIYRTEIDRLSLNNESERIYRAEDSLGNTILETDDYSIISQLGRGIRLKIIPVPKKVIILKDDSVDIVWGIMMKKLGKPYKAEYYYTITWRTPTGGVITLNKHPDTRPVIIASYRAREWMRNNLMSMRDIKEDTAQVKPVQVKPDTIKTVRDSFLDINRGVPIWIIGGEK